MGFIATQQRDSLTRWVQDCTRTPNLKPPKALNSDRTFPHENVANRDIDRAIRYHENTKHSELSVHLSHHHLDWENRPKAFKVYANAPWKSLPRNFPHPSLGALASMSSIEPPNQAPSISVETLAELLFFAAGVTREVRFPTGAYYMRAASATGALYPIELYVVCQDIPRLRAGVYHFGPGDFALTELRSGDYRAELSLAAGGSKAIAFSPLTIAFTSMAWRNAWKYQARSYRHWFWDSGVIAANLLATGISAGLPMQLVMGFDDARVDILLGLDEMKESTVALAPVGIGLAQLPQKQPGDLSRIRLETLPVSKEEAQYPEIWRAHRASSLGEREVSEWIKLGAAMKEPVRGTHGLRFSLQYSDGTSRELTLKEVILRRGSTRRFLPESIGFAQLSTVLRISTQGIPFDFLKDRHSLLETYLIANAVEALPSGAYFFNRQDDSLEQLKSGQLRKLSGYLCLEQPLFADASAVIFLMTDLREVLGRYGNRGYRAAQFEGGVILGKLYLSAYALGIGASGTTFYDDAVTEFFSPHAEGKSTMVAAGIGLPAYKASRGKILVGRLTRDQLEKQNS